MRQITHVIDTKMVNGKLVNICRNFEINENDYNVLAKAQSYFTKDEKKKAKLEYKLNN